MGRGIFSTVDECGGNSCSYAEIIYTTIPFLLRNTKGIHYYECSNSHLKSENCHIYHVILPARERPNSNVAPKALSAHWLGWQRLPSVWFTEAAGLGNGINKNGTAFCYMSLTTLRNIFCSIVVLGLFILDLLLFSRPGRLRDQLPDLNIPQALDLQI